MSNPNHISRIALIGASGTVGASILAALLATNRFQITILTHANSSSTFPSHPSITVKKGSYDDPSFLHSAFQNQDAAIFALGFTAMSEQPKLITAAAKAGVKWILPTEYAGDGMNQPMMDAVPLFAPKVAARRHIDELAKEHAGLKWIGIATNPWVDFSLKTGMCGIDIRGRKALLTEDAGIFNMSTLEQVGLAVARLMALPVRDEAHPRRSLEVYAGGFLYVSSFLTSQRKLFEAVLRATGTEEGEWVVEMTTTGEQVRLGREGMARGEMMAGAGLTFAYYMGEGLGGNYEVKAREDAEVLGLEDEDLDVIVQRIVDAGPGPSFV